MDVKPSKASLASQVEQALKLANEYALGSVHSDGHWYGELRSNVTVTAEYVFLRQALGLDLKADHAAYCRYILSQQNSDGSWGLAPEVPGDVSTSTEAYLALKILGLSIESSAMQKAREFVLHAGGVAKVRVFTRIFLATFGLFPWDAVPIISVELILLPSVLPINIYKFASWARGTIAPLLIICHHQPIYLLPNRKSACNDYLDELWQDCTNKNVPYSESLWTMLSQGNITGLAFGIVDKILYQLNGLRRVPLMRSYARKQCTRWILERQEKTGDWAGIFPPMHASIYAFMLEGYTLDDDPVRLGIEALERFAWENEHGKRIQPCVSPVWDTALMTIGLCDAMLPNRQTLSQAINWIRSRQLLRSRGDWQIYRPQLAPGGFSFEYENSWYPDVDDTAAIILAQLKYDAASLTSSSVLAAATWICGMQNPMLPFVVDITLANGAARRVFSVIERVSPINPMSDMGIQPASVRGEIRFVDVSFAYPLQPERTVLENASFTVPPGRSVALVGPSGSGKSTVFAILERLYLPFNGTITLDDEPIENINVSWLRTQIGYVGQDVSLFNASIHDNIAHGLSVAHEMSDESTVRSMVIQAAEKAQIHSFIMELPHGYDTVIGANGSSLSGGQRQRIAIARAIVSQPAILLLDEATASLDSQSEKNVQEALNEAASGRTTMIIAHRMSTVQNCDTIIVLKDGNVLGQGSHAELMKTSTVYQELVRHQALRSDDRPVEDLTCQLSYQGKDVEELKDVSIYVDGVGSPKDAPVSTLQPKNSVKYVWNLNKPELPYTIAGIIFSIMAGISYPIQAIFFGNGVISIISPDLSTGGHTVRFWALVYLIHGIVVFGIYCVRGYCFAMTASQLNLRARSSLFRCLLMKDLPFFETKGHSTGQLVTFLSSGTHKVTGVSGTSFGLAAESIVMLATGIIVGCIFGWELGLVSTAAVPLMTLSGFLQHYTVSQVQKHVKRDTNAATVAHEAFAAIKTVTVLGMQKTILETFRRESQRDSQGRYWVICAAVYACTPLLRVLSIAFVFWYGGTRLVPTGEYSIQQFFICFAANVWSSQSAAALFAHAPDIAGAHAAANRLEGLMQPNESQYPNKKQDDVSTPAPCKIEELALQRVKFKYPTRPSHMALDDVSFDVQAGAFIALVGTTGSGKSSVINLVERFYNTQSGNIILSEKAIGEYDLDGYRQYLALVDQNPCLVGEDMRECLQSDERVISDDDILVALQGVGLADFVLSLPQGLSSPVLANGSSLSGGQRQRMAIAKAILWGPKILLLDEATSALDTASEKLIQEALKHAMKDRTTIAVAHRLKTIVDASKILVFDGGRIVEQGTHDELMHLRGKYWQMARLQMDGEE